MWLCEVRRSRKPRSCKDADAATQAAGTQPCPLDCTLSCVLLRPSAVRQEHFKLFCHCYNALACHFTVLVLVLANPTPQEHSKLFCLCQKPYDESAPMVGCANCKVGGGTQSMGWQRRCERRWWGCATARRGGRRAAPAARWQSTWLAAMSSQLARCACCCSFKSHYGPSWCELTDTHWLLGYLVLQEWYHHRCVGLRAPGAPEREGDEPPASFRCPLCCMRVRRQWEARRVPRSRACTAACRHRSSPACCLLCCVRRGAGGARLLHSALG